MSGMTPSSSAIAGILRAGEQGIIVLTGEIDIGNSPELHACLERFLADGCSEIILDITDVTYIGSTGLAEIAHVTKALKLRGGGVALRNPSPATRNLLNVAGLATFFEVPS